MKYISKLQAFAACAMLAGGIVSVHAQQTKILTADKHNEYGLIYTLPVTALRVEVTAMKTVSHAGPYYQYAKKYTGAGNVVMEDSESWEIENVKVTPYGVASTEPETSYLMQLKPGMPTYIGVSEDGMLLSINAEPTLPAMENSELEQPEQEEIGESEYLQYVSGDFLASKSKAKQAQMLAESLMEIRESKVALTRGTADQMPTDGRQLELMLNSLAHQEASLTSAFTGIVTKERVSRTFTFIPSEEGRSVLFRMSDFAGFVAADDYSGDPVYVNVEIVSEPELPSDSKGEEKKFPKDGVAYCLPGTAKVTMSLLGKTLWSGEGEYSQFGTVFGLDPKIFTDKKKPSYAIFNSATGAIEKIGLADENTER